MATIAHSALLIGLSRFSAGSRAVVTAGGLTRADRRRALRGPSDPPMLPMDLASTGSPVRVYQSLLRRWSPSLPLDGWVGPRTSAACRTFQRACGLTATGDMRRVGDWQVLLRDANVGPGASGVAVRAIQASLHLDADGWYGPRTEGATRRYQRMANTTGHLMPVDGRYGRLTWAFTLRPC